jgi:hypothetical protein
MRSAALLGPAATDHPSVLDDNAANRRIGPDLAEAATRQCQRGVHMSEIVLAINH